MKKSLTYAFLDESPSLNSKDFFFCIGIISTDKKTNKKLEDILKKARTKIKKKLRKLLELKFYHSDKRTRLYVLSELAKQKIKIVAFVIDKEKRKIKDTPENYGFVVGAAVSELLSIHPVLSLTVHKRYTNKKQLQQFQEATQETISKLATKGVNVFFNPPAEGKTGKVVQLADFVAGAFNSKYNREIDCYTKIIKNKVEIEKVIKWTKLKKRIVKP